MRVKTGVQKQEVSPGLVVVRVMNVIGKATDVIVMNRSARLVSGTATTNINPIGTTSEA